MVRGNWQKRVEQAEVRRKENKQKKVNRSSRSANKGLVLNQLWPFLNDIPITSIDPGGTNYTEDKGSGVRGNAGPGRHSRGRFSEAKENVIQLWVDSPPLSSKSSYHSMKDNTGDSYLDQEYQQHLDKQKKKSKRESKKNTPNKKLHPRSHENMTTPDKESGGSSGNGGGSVNNKDGLNDDTLLCRSHFFNGTCQFTSNSSTKSSKKSSSSRNCPFYHFNKKQQQMTLIDALLGEKKNNNKRNSNDDANVKAILKQSSDAAASAYHKSTGGLDMVDLDDENNTETKSISMIYYIEINLGEKYFQSENDDDGANTTKVSDIIAEHLSSEKCPIGSIVFTVFKDTLIFDRNIGGIIVEKEQCDHIFNSVEKKRSSSIESNGEYTSINVDFKLLPVTVLEHILTFLPDETSGLLPSVCKGWNTEIGKTSPALWQYLLSRRNWPGLPYHTEKDTKNVNDKSTLAGKTKQIFVSHKNICQAVDTFIEGYIQLTIGESSSRKTLAMHNFKDSRENNNNHSTTRTHSICCWDDSTLITSNHVECTLSIFKATKLDDSSAGLYCKQLVSVRVAPFPHSKKNTCQLQSFDLDKDSILCCYEVNETCDWLVLVKRDDLLLNSAESVLDSDFIKKYELTKLLVDYCIKMKDETLSRYVLNEDFYDIDASIVNDIVACKGGNFVFMIDILMADDDTDDDVMRIRMIVQFSTKKESLIWCKPVSHWDEDNAYLSPYNLSPGAIVYTSIGVQPIATLNIDQRQGIVSTSLDQEKVETLSQNLLVDGWEMSLDSPKRLSIISHSYIVLADVLSKVETTKVVLSIFSLEDENLEPSFLSMNDLQNILSMHIHGDYAILLCEGRGFDQDAIDGHWFGDENMNDQNQYFCAVIVHIPSKTEIYRRDCLDKECDMSDLQLVFGSSSLPMIFAAGDKGILISGQMLKDVKLNIQHEKPKSSTKTKAKKKKKGFKNNKKDGFARGMSLRG